MQFQARERVQVTAFKVGEVPPELQPFVKFTNGSYRVQTSRGTVYATTDSWFVITDTGSTFVESDEKFRKMFEMVTPRPGEKWRHRKGHLYTIIDTAILERHKEDVVVYRSDADDVVWVRPLKEFIDGRFVRES